MTSYSFQCPYCSQEISIPVDYSAGRSQAFTYDCEVCCRPIAIKIQVGADGVTGFSAEREE